MARDGFILLCVRARKHCRLARARLYVAATTLPMRILVAFSEPCIGDATSKMETVTRSLTRLSLERNSFKGICFLLFFSQSSSRDAACTRDEYETRVLFATIATRRVSSIDGWKSYVENFRSESLRRGFLSRVVRKEDFR